MTATTASTASGASTGATASAIQQQQFVSRQRQEKLKEYDALLAAFYTHLERPEPEEPEIKSVANWMDGKKPVAFAESTFLNDWSDLRRAKHSVEKGGLETFLGRYAGVSSLCKDSNPKSEDPQIQFIKQSKVVAVSRALTTLFAVATLVVPIGILYAVKAVPTRLWVIAAFTGVFSSSLCWLTSSRNYEIFSATAAYCAVMVVFVGSLPN
ncbi:hypothetical protein CDV36_003723 [Fusarium kuroshium]|uniref:DUF6594 domain-containing protein n=1 Tax=Fusarium kuroshium TaxID=2010991 RepID=A0A3M2SG68_9HYPO|nr:hypothetical protein CDV36_003723 [Fusarium kuroshium]